VCLLERSKVYAIAVLIQRERVLMIQTVGFSKYGACKCRSQKYFSRLQEIRKLRVSWTMQYTTFSLCRDFTDSLSKPLGDLQTLGFTGFLRLESWVKKRNDEKKAHRIEFTGGTCYVMIP
jgi:hypothetical protein